MCGARARISRSSTYKDALPMSDGTATQKMTMAQGGRWKRGGHSEECDSRSEHLTDEECFARIWRLYQQDGCVDVDWIAIPSGIGELIRHGGRRISGIVLDLTRPTAARQDEQAQEAH